MSFTPRQSSHSLLPEPTTPTIALIGGNLRFIAVTHAFAAVLGLMPEQLIGRPLAELCGSADPKADHEQFQRLLSGKLPQIELVKHWTRPSRNAIRARLVITPAQGLADEIYCAIAKITPIADSVCAASPTSTPTASESDSQIERIRKAMMW